MKKIYFCYLVLHENVNGWIDTRLCAAAAIIPILHQDRRCNDVKLIIQHLCPELESFFLNCKPFYSSFEFASMILVGVYIPPQVNAQEAQRVLAPHPNSLVIVLGDFNGGYLRSFPNTDSLMSAQLERRGLWITVTQVVRTPIMPFHRIHLALCLVMVHLIHITADAAPIHQSPVPFYPHP